MADVTEERSNPGGEPPPCIIVFVCTGNTCRSPMAEAICKKGLADRLGCAIDDLPERGFVICSAGLAAEEGAPAAEHAVAIARSLGVDLTAHQSEPLTAELVEQATHLLGMTQGHVSIMEAFFPGKARLLSPTGEDVVDPIGQPQEVYDACARQMTGYIEKLVEEVVAGQSPDAPHPPAPSLKEGEGGKEG
jgi:protein-tyrosine phosphatase